MDRSQMSLLASLKNDSSFKSNARQCLKFVLKKTWGSRPHLKNITQSQNCPTHGRSRLQLVGRGSLLLNSLPLAKLKNNNGPSFANVQLSLKWSFLPTRTCAHTHTLATTLSCSHTHTHTLTVIGVCLFPSSTMVSRVASMAYNFLWPQALFSTALGFTEEGVAEHCWGLF